MKQLHAPVMHWFNHKTPDCADRLVLCDIQLGTATATAITQLVIHSDLNT